MDPAEVRGLPTAVLHDHLDGGLRAEPILELADEAGYADLPAEDADELAGWFHQGDSGSLERYLQAFRHTIAVMQTPRAIERVAYEAVADLAATDAVYAELRLGPTLHATMSPESAIEAALAGIRRGSAETGCVTGLIASALRHMDDSEVVARAAVRFAGEGVVGFDLAGPEAGFPADDHLPAFRMIREAGFGLTIHAGEGEGPESIWRALGRCGAQRIGHGVRIVDDTKRQDSEIALLGDLARSVRNLQVPLEICITSNIHTGLADTPAQHPFGALCRAGFAVTINTDNRLMSGITLSDEYGTAVVAAALELADLGHIVERTIQSGFGDYVERRRLIEDVVRPAYGLT